METQAIEQPSTLAEFLEGDYESYEFVEGELIPMAAAKIIHGDVAAEILGLLFHYVKEHQLGKLYTAETVFTVGNRGRKPDVAFVASERIPDDLWQNFPIPPDLAIEVVSETDALKAVHEKAFEYLDAGTQLVWAIEPFSQTVIIYRSPTDISLLTIDDTLTGDPAVKGFQCRVADLFT